MKLDSPFGWIPDQWLYVTWVILIIATLAVGRNLQKQGVELDRLLPNGGILEVEAPWTSERAKRIKDSLENGKCMQVARDQILGDFVFLIYYPLAISLSCALVSGKLDGQFGVIGMMIAWGVLLAGPLDAVENLCMLRYLADHTAPPWPQISTICAVIKFTLIAGGLSFSFIGLGLLLKDRYL